MLPMKSTLSKMTRKLVALLPKKLMLEVSGLDAGKFRIVQLPWMLIWAGGTGLTKPSITPLFCADGQVSAACAGMAVSSNSASENSRILIQLSCVLALFPVIYALVPLTNHQHQLISGPRQPPCRLNFGGFGPPEYHGDGLRQQRHTRANPPVTRVLDISARSALIAREAAWQDRRREKAAAVAASATPVT